MATQRRFRIVIALDGSEYSNIVLEHALDQAARHDTVDVHVVRVVTDKDAPLDPIKTWLADSVRDGLDSFRRAPTEWRIRLHVRCGRAEEEIANLAGEVAADLLVVGRYGLHHPFHSTADRVIALAECPTLVIGLAGHEVDPAPQCAACVQLREDTDAERLFCDEHTDTRDLWLSTLVTSGGSSSGSSTTTI